MAGNFKVTDEQFWAAMEEAGGICSKAAKIIEKEFDVTFSRQAAHKRAKEDPERHMMIREKIVDIAEEGLLSLLQSEDEKVKAQMAKFALSTLGKHRGFVEKQEVDHTTGGKPFEINIVSYSPSQTDDSTDDHNNTV